MTRFKELRRIQAALEDTNESELRWAQSYCRMRVSIAARKEHTTYWRGMERKVADALRALAKSAADQKS